MICCSPQQVVFQTSNSWLLNQQCLFDIDERKPKPLHTPVSNDIMITAKHIPYEDPLTACLTLVNRSVDNEMSLSNKYSVEDWLIELETVNSLLSTSCSLSHRKVQNFTKLVAKCFYNSEEYDQKKIAHKVTRNTCLLVEQRG